MEPPELTHWDRATTATPPLDPKQQQILELCLTGQHTFLTGIGGTCKPFLLQQIADSIARKLGADRVAVRASAVVATRMFQGYTLPPPPGCRVPAGASSPPA